MSVKSDKVKSGYIDLTDAEKLEVRSFIQRYDNGTYTERINLSEQTRTFSKSLGPKSDSSCPCCGK